MNLPLIEADFFLLIYPTLGIDGKWGHGKLMTMKTNIEQARNRLALAKRDRRRRQAMLRDFLRWRMTLAQFRMATALGREHLRHGVAREEAARAYLASLEARYA